MLPNVRLTNSVWSFDCGWHAELRLIAVCRHFQSSRQKWLINLTSQSNVMLCGKPWRQTTSWKNRRATCIASKVLLQAMKCAIFEKRLTTTMIESKPFFVLGSPKMKWTLRSSKMESSTSNKVYNSVFCLFPLYS